MEDLSLLYSCSIYTKYIMIIKQYNKVSNHHCLLCVMLQMVESDINHRVWMINLLYLLSISRYVLRCVCVFFMLFNFDDYNNVKHDDPNLAT